MMENYTIFPSKSKNKDQSVFIDGRNFFEQPIKNHQITYDNIQKIVTGQGDDYTTGCVLDSLHEKTYFPFPNVLKR